MSVTTPAMPASTVAVKNTTGKQLSVTITGGTLTSVVIDGTQAGTVAGSYPLKPGSSISITYSVAPTWAWTDPPDLAQSGSTFGTQNTTENNPANWPMGCPQHEVAGETGLASAVTN